MNKRSRKKDNKWKKIFRERKKVDHKQRNSSEVTEPTTSRNHRHKKPKYRDGRSDGNGATSENPERNSRKRQGAQHIICGICGYKLPNPNHDPSSIPLMTKHLKVEHGIK